MFARSEPVSYRRMFVAAAVVALVAASGVTAAQAQTPPAAPAPAPAAGQTPAPAAGQTPTPAAPAAAPAAPSLGFTGDGGLLLFTVKAEGAADFEAFFNKVKEALEKSPKPEYKQMAAGWKIYKVTDGAAAGQTLYAGVVDPAVKGADYDPVKILSEVLPDDARLLYPKLAAAIVSVNKLNLQYTIKMGGGN